MKFRNFLSESTISGILKEGKIFLLIIGGSASGKNYIYQKNFSKIPLIDIDKITTELSGGDFEKARSFVSKAVSIANKDIEKYLEQGKSVAQVSTGSGDKAVINKFNKAKEYGFKTALILVDVDIDKSIKRNQERANSGKQGLIPDWKVEKTNAAAKDTYNKIKHLVDYSLIVKN